jgi:hypothetical protein
VRIAGGVNEQVAEETVHQPRGAARPIGNLPKGEGEFVERIVARLVNARALARRAKEEVGCMLTSITPGSGVSPDSPWCTRAALQ